MEVLSARFTRAALAVAGLVAIYLVWVTTGIGGRNVAGGFDDIAECVAAAIAAICCAVAARRDPLPRMRATWWWFAASALCWAIGEGVWTGSDAADPNRTSVPIPSYADLGFCAALLCALVAILLFPAGSGGRVARLRLFLDGVTTSGSLLFIAWVTALDAVYHAGMTSSAERTLTLVYPVGDLLLAGVALSMFSSRLGRRAIPLGLIIGGLLLFGFADSALAFLNQSGQYGTGSNPTDVGWFAGYLLVALAALVPVKSAAQAERQTQLTRWQLFFPYLPLLAAVATALVEVGSGRHLTKFDGTVGLVIAVAVAGRQYLALEENRRLTRQLESTVNGLRRNQAALRFQGYHDAVTGLANRFRLAEQAKLALAGDPGEGLVAIVLCDLDGFKDVNDVFGHDIGDAMLVELGRRMESAAPLGSLVARIGADEFAVLINGVNRLEDAGQLAAQLLEAAQVPVSVRGTPIELSASIGVACSGRGQMSFDVLMRNVDIALDEAKRQGRGAVQLFDRQLGEAFRDRTALQTELSQALGKREFFLEYQPIVSADHGWVIGVEALLRWNHPRRGVLHPDAFLSVAEATGEIVPIGAWVLEEALRQIARIRTIADAAAGMWVAVNVSARQFSTGDLVGSVVHAIASSGLESTALRLELTESAFIDQSGRALSILDELHSLGVQLEIDDFGTGYSSLGYLKRLPIHAIKIDRTFVIGLGTEQHDTAIVAAMINLAHALGLEVVAEGIETPHQLAQLRALHCDQVQGFYTSRPLSPVALTDWLLLAVAAVESR